MLRNSTFTNGCLCLTVSLLGNLDFGITLESSSDSNGFLTAPMKSPLWFKPYLTSCLPGGLMVNYLKNSFATEKVKSTKKEKRRILIVQNSVY